MAVKLEEQNSVLVAKLSGRYLDQGEDYRGDFQTIYGDLQQKPRIVVISLGEVSNIDRRALTAIEKLCWKVAKDLGQEIRLAYPTEGVRRTLDRVDFTIPVYETVEKAFESFEEDEFLEDADLFDDEPPPTVTSSDAGNSR